VALVDSALDRVAALVGAGPWHVAVNARHHGDLLEAHVGGRAHVSDERSYPDELGTAGAVGALRDWLDGRGVLVVNGDTWTTVDLEPLLDGWDGERVRVLVHGPSGGSLRPGARIVGSLVPASDAAAFPAEPLGLSNGLWWPAAAAGRVDVLTGAGMFVACDTPADYLAANLAVSGGESVVGEGARVDGQIERCVIWPGAVVRRDEVLTDAIRCDRRTTVLVRPRDVPRAT
jgi:NDP-sugar pyrophosphorylase family protein